MTRADDRNRTGAMVREVDGGDNYSADIKKIAEDLILDVALLKPTQKAMTG